MGGRECDFWPPGNTTVTGLHEWFVVHAGVEGDLRLVHPRIAAPVAEALGVTSRRRVLLAASADCLALGLAGAGGAVEAFGQSEALTTRLRHIIQVLPVLEGSPRALL